MSFEGQTFAKRIELDRKLLNLSKRFEEKISFLDKEIKGLVSRDFPEIVGAFNELKRNLTSRLLEAWKAGRQEKVNESLQEVLEILDTLAEVIASGLSGYEVSNIISADSGELISSHFKKDIIDERGNKLKTVSVHFNFVPTDKSEARFKITTFDHQADAGEAEKSFHIDRDERLGGVYIDINAPNLEKTLRGIQDQEKGYGHHFKSETLSDFISTENFSRLVKEFKEIILAQETMGDDEPVTADMLEMLRQRFSI